MKKLITLILTVCLCVGMVAVSAEELQVYEYRNIYLDFAWDAASAGVGAYSNCLNKEIDGMIMLNLNEDNVPELLTYTKEEVAYNEAMELLTPESEGYDKPYYVSEKYYLEDALSIIDGKVVSSAPWFEAGNEKGMPMAILPDKVSEMPTDYATFLTTFDGKLSLFSFEQGNEAFNILTYQNNKFEYKSEEYSSLDGRIGEEKGVAVSVEVPQYDRAYEHLFILLDKYETELNKTNPEYTPVTSDWAMAEVNAAIEEGLLPEKMFYNNLTYVVTRAEFAACVVNMYEKKFGKVELPETEVTFTDIENHKYEEEIKKACYLGITNGLGNNEFGPDINVEREDIATMFCRAFKKANFENWTFETDEKFAVNYFDVPVFEDDDRISLYAKPSVYFMSKYGIVKGIGENRFAPNWAEDGTGFATREEVVIMTLRFFCCDFTLDNSVNYDVIIKNYVKDNYTDFCRGFMLTDLNKDAVPELFSLRQLGNEVVAHFYEFVGGSLNDTMIEFVVGADINNLAKTNSRYISPNGYCDIFFNINTMENSLVCAYVDDSESIIDNNMYYTFRVLNTVSYDGRNLTTVQDRCPANDIQAIIAKETTEFFQSSARPYICVSGNEAFSKDDTEKAIAEVLEQFRTPESEIKASDGTAEYYIRDMYLGEGKFVLIPKYNISYDNYISSKENGTPIVINGKSYFVKFDVHMYQEFGEAELVGEDGESYWFYVPEAGGESVVEHFYELPVVYAYMDFDTKITLCNDFDDGTDTITKLNNSREYEHGGHGYKLTIKDNIITEMVEVYGE